MDKTNLTKLGEENDKLRQRLSDTQRENIKLKEVSFSHSHEVPLRLTNKILFIGIINIKLDWNLLATTHQSNDSSYSLILMSCKKKKKKKKKKM